MQPERRDQAYLWDMLQAAYTAARWMTDMDARGALADLERATAGRGVWILRVM